MFELGISAEVQTVIYDLNGNEVKKLMDARVPAGKYNLVWEGNDDIGSQVPNGTYLVSVYADGICVGSEKAVKKGK